MACQKAFTLIELLVVISIMGAFTIAISRYAAFQDVRILTTETKKLKTSLSEIKSRAIAGEKPVSCTPFGGYNMTISGNTVRARTVCNGSPAGSYIDMPVGSAVSISGSTGFPFNFKVHTGAAGPTSASITLQFKTATKTITIEESGVISF